LNGAIRAVWWIIVDGGSVWWFFLEMIDNRIFWDRLLGILGFRLVTILRGSWWWVMVMIEIWQRMGCSSVCCYCRFPKIYSISVYPWSDFSSPLSPFRVVPFRYQFFQVCLSKIWVILTVLGWDCVTFIFDVQGYYFIIAICWVIWLLLMRELVHIFVWDQWECSFLVVRYIVILIRVFVRISITGFGVSQLLAICWFQGYFLFFLLKLRTLMSISFQLCCWYVGNMLQLGLSWNCHLMIIAELVLICYHDTVYVLIYHRLVRW
jgi:hypothetical protein